MEQGSLENANPLMIIMEDLQWILTENPRSILMEDLQWTLTENLQLILMEDPQSILRECRREAIKNRMVMEDFLPQIGPTPMTGEP